MLQSWAAEYQVVHSVDTTRPRCGKRVRKKSGYRWDNRSITAITLCALYSNSRCRLHAGCPQAARRLHAGCTQAACKMRAEFKHKLIKHEKNSRPSIVRSTAKKIKMVHSRKLQYSPNTSVNVRNRIPNLNFCESI